MSGYGQSSSGFGKTAMSLDDYMKGPGGRRQVSAFRGGGPDPSSGPSQARFNHWQSSSQPLPRGLSTSIPAPVQPDMFQKNTASGSSKPSQYTSAKSVMAGINAQSDFVPANFQNKTNDASDLFGTRNELSGSGAKGAHVAVKDFAITESQPARHVFLTSPEKPSFLPTVGQSNRNSFLAGGFGQEQRAGTVNNSSKRVSAAPARSGTVRGRGRSKQLASRRMSHRSSKDSDISGPSTLASNSADDSSKFSPQRNRGGKCRSPSSSSSSDSSSKSLSPLFFSGTKRNAPSIAKPAPVSQASKPAAPTSNCGMEELDDDDLEELNVFASNNSMVSSRVPLSTLTASGIPITLEQATELKMVIFGSTMQVFNPEWTQQSLTFNNRPRLRYGIIQKKGGPCGLLAAVQAFVLLELLFVEGSGRKTLAPNGETRLNCLVCALTRILWRAGGKRKAVVALPGSKVHFAGGARFKADGLIEKLVLCTLTTEASLKQFLGNCISQFEADGGSGVVLFLYSLALSHGCKKCKADMDTNECTFIGAHGYCTQDMVNLITTGKASSNAFDDKIVLGDGKDKIVLKGVTSRCEVGLLSLFEHYESIKVGEHLKSPIYPIWIICSESHFSVLFSMDQKILKDWKSQRTFDLYYYDGLANQEDEIRLTVDATKREPPSYGEGELVPPLEHCIRTKWKNAHVDWNGREKIL